MSRKDRPAWQCTYLYHNRSRRGPGGFDEWHSHKFHHIEFVRNGTLVTQLGDDVLHDGPERFVFLPAGRGHRFRYPDKDVTVFSVKFDVVGIEPGHELVSGAVSPQLAVVRDSLDCLLASVARPEGPARDAIDQMVTAMLVLAMDVLYADSGKQKEDTIVDRVKAIVDAKEGLPVTVAEIAGELGLSQQYLRRQFTKSTGGHIKNFLDARRAVAVERLLQYSDMPVKVIVERLGFAGVSTFSRFCARMFGHGPREFRERHSRRTNIVYEEEKAGVSRRSQ